MLLFKWLKAFCKNEDAPTFIEYGLLIALIALVVVAAATVLGTAVSGLFVNGANAFPP